MARKDSGLDKSMEAQVATLGENFCHLVLGWHLLLGVVIHRLKCGLCCEAERVRVEGSFEGY